MLKDDESKGFKKHSTDADNGDMVGSGMFRSSVPERWVPDFDIPTPRYGHLLHDLLPMLVWMASRYPKTKLIVVLDEEEKIRRFLQWFNMDLFHRAIFIPEESLVGLGGAKHHFS